MNMFLAMNTEIMFYATTVGVRVGNVFMSCVYSSQVYYMHSLTKTSVFGLKVAK